VRTVLLTGASGFIGRHLLRHLAERYRVITLGRQGLDGFEHIAFDLRKTRRLPVAEIPPGAILVHAAAEVRRSQGDDTDPARFHRINVEGTERLLRAITPCAVSYVLYLSTTDVSEPSTAYAQSKLAAEDLVRQFCRGAGIARLGSIYGPGEDAFGKLVPAAIRAAVAQQSVTAYGNARIDLLFVDDAARALVTMVSHRAAGLFDVVSGEPVRVMHVIETINSLAGNPAPVKRVDAATCDRVFAPSALTAFGWKPSTPLPVGLRREIAAVRKRLPLVAIDLDGTLLDHWQRMYGLYRAYLTARGLRPLSFAAYRQQKRAGKSEAEIAGTLPGYLEWKRARIEEWQWLSSDTLHVHGQALLQQLAPRAHLVLVTSRQRPRLVRRQLRALGILDCFTRIICVPGEDPEAKTAAFRKLQPLWYIGDTEADIAAARRAGVRPAVVPWGLRSVAFLKTLRRGGGSLHVIDHQHLPLDGVR
jgi:nucleoside-diphosphate-sugar epimerase/phosphoglycolate phosphatase-like HAD superfamily hydrolase